MQWFDVLYDLDRLVPVVDDHVVLYVSVRSQHEALLLLKAFISTFPRLI
jgi:hypothetical protein